MKIKGFYRKPINETINPKNIAEGLLSVPQILKEVQNVQDDIVKVVDQELKKIDDKITELDKNTAENAIKVNVIMEEAKGLIQSTAQDAVDYIRTIKIKDGEPGKDAEPVDTEKLKAEILAKIPKIPTVDENAIVKRVIAKIPESKASLKVIQETFETDPMSVIDKILSLGGKFKLKTENIDGLDQTIRALNTQIGNRGYIHGGGDTVEAGTNITLVRLASGKTQINATGGGTVGPGTTNEIAYFNAPTTITSLSTATYPSLAELSYVKGVTSAIQTQIDGKQATLVSATNIKTINGNTLLGSGDLIISGGGDLVVDAEPGNGKVAAGTQVDSFDEVGDTFWNMNNGSVTSFQTKVKVPTGATSISKIELFYLGTSVGNNVLKFRTSKLPTGSGNTVIEDTSNADTIYAGANADANKIYSWTVPTDAYNALGSVVAGDNIGIKVLQNGASGSYSYGGSAVIFWVRFTFA